MTLERGNDGFGHRIEKARYLDTIAVQKEHRLQFLDILAPAARGQNGPLAMRCRIDEMADAMLGEQAPGKFFAGIHLATGRHIRMGEYPFRQNAMAG